MKKTLLTFLFSLFGAFMLAQTTYEKTLNEKARKISDIKTIADCDKLFDEFSALKRNPDPYRWKAYYYAGLALYNKAELILKSNKKNGVENVNGLAEKYVLGSLTAAPDDKENNDLLKLILEQRSRLGVNGTIQPKKK
ncbi:hypothetical protein VUJ46_16650 [Chryseobacterium sp. MYb264]|uniref:hypothetical protein n=1 Tax=Chryseobacterium sp. MYb264 TaxID=2745153 RepID=UPI002E1113E5|nr:hypothetical protein VUJ46_16650 [Chryseobacterium sp. MYb264]